MNRLGAFFRRKLKVKVAALEKRKYFMSKDNRKIVVESVFIRFNKILFFRPHLKTVQTGCYTNFHGSLSTNSFIFRIMKSGESTNLSRFSMQERRQGRIMIRNVEQDLYQHSFVLSGSTFWNQLLQFHFHASFFLVRNLRL